MADKLIVFEIFSRPEHPRSFTIFPFSLEKNERIHEGSMAKRRKARSERVTLMTIV